jgi:hypothetical protein
VTPIYELTYAPNLDTSWNVNPGALVGMDGFAPLPNRAYGSVAIADWMTNITGADTLDAKMFRQVDGSVRLLLFRESNIDEYSTGGVRTNRGSGYTSSADWNSAAWGNQIIATNYLDAPQSSTGAGFSALSGTPPKGRFVASNVNFVMFADVDDGGSNVYSDMVWWSAIQNPTSWTASIATQAGNVRLLDSPGPITALVAFRDKFICFKKNSIFVGEYVGPPFIFQWRMISNRVGCVAPKSVVECDNALYWIDTAGIFRYDGSSIVNIGVPVFQTILNTITYHGSLATDYTAVPITKVRATADDNYGVIWFAVYTLSDISNVEHYSMYCFNYNVRTGKWGRCTLAPQAQTLVTIPPTFVRASTADINDFIQLSLPGILFVNNATSNAIKKATYPTSASGVTPSVSTGLWGSIDGSSPDTRLYVRALAGSDPTAMETCTVYGYASEITSSVQDTKTASLNSALSCFDYKMNARFKQAVVSDTGGNITLVSGIGVQNFSGPR